MPNGSPQVFVWLFAVSALFFFSIAVGQETPLQVDLQTLSSARFEGRATGTPGNKLARQYIAQRYADIGLQPIGLQPIGSRQDFYHSFSVERAFKPIEGVNVAGVIRGSGSPYSIVITAHYDHLGKQQGKSYLGADDNASGVAAMLALASFVRQASLYHDVVFLATDAEESGLYGAKAALQKPIMPLRYMRVNLNLDMLAQVGKPAKLYLSGERTSAHLTGITDWLNHHSNKLISHPIRVIKEHRQPTSRHSLLNKINYAQASDHAEFAKLGIPYLFFGVGDHRFYHTEEDRFERIHFAQFVTVVEQVKILLTRIDSVMHDPDSVK